VQAQYPPSFFAAIATFTQVEEIISIGVRHAASAYQHVSRIAHYLFFKALFPAFPFGVNFEVKHGSEQVHFSRTFETECLSPIRDCNPINLMPYLQLVELQFGQ